MALIESLNDDRVKKLKSLKYGANKPLVTKDINKAPSPQGIGLQASRRIDDLERISKFFVSPSGLKYLGNEALLKQSGLEQRIKDARKPDGSRVGNLLRQGNQILKEAGSVASDSLNIIGSTLAQVPLNGTGTHFFKGFRSNIDFYPNTRLPDLNEEKDNNLLKTGRKLSETNERLNFNNDGVNTTETSAEIQDFRRGVNSYKLNYRDVNIKRETRVKLGNQGKNKTKPLTGYTNDIGDGLEIDGINMLPPIDFSEDLGEQVGNKTVYDRPAIGVTKGRDLIKFRFEVITPDTLGPKRTMLYFRAFLDSFNDNYNADWSKNNYLGRGEAFYTYGGFDRSINLGFKIAAATRHEMQPLYQKMVFLASATAPTYSANFMRGTLVNLTVGDYVYNMPGFLEQVGYTWNVNYPWEIAMSKPEADPAKNLNPQDLDMQELPHVLDCSINFKPIHPFTPQTGLYHYITSPAATTNAFFDKNGKTSPVPSSEIRKLADTVNENYRLQPEKQKTSLEAAAKKAKLAQQNSQKTDSQKLQDIGVDEPLSRGEQESGFQ